MKLGPGTLYLQFGDSTKWDPVLHAKEAIVGRRTITLTGVEIHRDNYWVAYPEIFYLHEAGGYYGWKAP